MLPGLETRWLRAEKWISPPPIYAARLEGCGAFYQPAFDGEILVGNLHVDASKGVIVYNEAEHLVGLFEAAIAHEFRHHWQHMRGWKYDGKPWCDARDWDSYKKGVQDYYLKSHSEMDAFLYEFHKAPYAVNKLQMDFIQEALQCHTNHVREIDAKQGQYR